MVRQPLMAHGLLIQGFTIILRHTTIHRTPLDKWSARWRDVYLTIHSTHKRQTFTSLAGFKSAIPTSEWLQTHALDHAATGIGTEICTRRNINMNDNEYHYQKENKTLMYRYLDRKWGRSAAWNVVVLIIFKQHVYECHINSVQWIINIALFLYHSIDVSYPTYKCSTKTSNKLYIIGQPLNLWTIKTTELIQWVNTM